MLYANFPHETASVMTAVVFVVWTLEVFASLFVLFKDSPLILILWYNILYH